MLAGIVENILCRKTIYISPFMFTVDSDKIPLTEDKLKQQVLKVLEIFYLF